MGGVQVWIYRADGSVCVTAFRQGRFTVDWFLGLNLMNMSTTAVTSTTRLGENGFFGREDFPSRDNNIPLTHMPTSAKDSSPASPAQAAEAVIQTGASNTALTQLSNRPSLENTELQAPASPIYPTGYAPHLLFALVSLTLLLTELDNQILAPALPAITSTFHSVADVGWYGSGYRLAVCGFQFMFGKLYRTFELRRVFLVSLVVFEIGSAVCGAAGSSAVFIFGRVVSGVGAGGIFAGVYQ